MASIVEKENERFKLELEEGRALIEQIQQSDSVDRNTSDYSATTNLLA